MIDVESLLHLFCRPLEQVVGGVGAFDETRKRRDLIGDREVRSQVARLAIDIGGRPALRVVQERLVEAVLVGAPQVAGVVVVEIFLKAVLALRGDLAEGVVLRLGGDEVRRIEGRQGVARGGAVAVAESGHHRTAHAERALHVARGLRLSRPGEDNLVVVVARESAGIDQVASLPQRHRQRGPARLSLRGVVKGDARPRLLHSKPNLTAGGALGIVVVSLLRGPACIGHPHLDGRDILDSAVPAVAAAVEPAELRSRRRARRRDRYVAVSRDAAARHVVHAHGDIAAAPAGDAAPGNIDGVRSVPIAARLVGEEARHRDDAPPRGNRRRRERSVGVVGRLDCRGLVTQGVVIEKLDGVVDESVVVGDRLPGLGDVPHDVVGAIQGRAFRIHRADHVAVAVVEIGRDLVVRVRGRHTVVFRVDTARALRVLSGPHHVAEGVVLHRGERRDDL